MTAHHQELRRLTMAVHMGQATLADLGAFVALHIDELSAATMTADERSQRIIEQCFLDSYEHEEWQKKT